MDYKYDILKHPKVLETTDGKEKPYIYGSTENSVASIQIDFDMGVSKLDIEEDIESDYEVISSEEMEDYLKEMENRNEKRK